MSAFDIGYRLNNGTPVVQPWVGSPLAACDTASVTFTGVTLGAGINNMKVFTAVAGDGNMLNDTFNVDVTPALSGTYVIGAAPSDFVSFTEATNALVKRGISGAVVFNVKNGTYTESVEVPAIVGASPTKTITFKSLNNDPSLVTLTYATDFSRNFTLKVNCANYINVKALKVVATGPQYAHPLEIVGSSSYDTIENCIIMAPSSTTTTNDLTALWAYGVRDGNLVIRNNTITGGTYGLYLYGVSTAMLSPDNIVENNDISGAYYYTAYTYYTSNLKFRNNTITVAAPIYSTHYGTNIYYSYNGFEFVGNKITATGLTSTVYAAHIAYSTGTALAPGLVKNNTIVVGTTSTSYGLSTQYSTFQNYYNNSVNSISTGATNYTAYIYHSSATYVNNDYRNNIFCNSGTTGYAMYTYNPLYMNGAHNLLYSNNPAGLVYKGVATATAYPSLNLYRAAFPDQEINSLVYRPAFTAAVNLQPNAADSAVWAINGRGVHSPLAVADINGVVRPQTRMQGTPDIGAYEVTPTSLPPLATASPAAPTAGTTQSFIFANDTVATIDWDLSYPVPADLKVRFYSGVWPQYANFPADYGTNCYWKMEEVGPNPPYYFNLKLRYYEPMLGTIPSKQDMKLSMLTGTVWNTYQFSLSETDTIAYKLKANGLNTFSTYTGTDNTLPLPVKLATFTVNKNKEDVQVSWQTASEQNSNHFEVERSVDGNSFVKVGSVKAAGNSNSPIRYALNDANAFNLAKSDVLYYRLKMIDNDGKFEYSRIVAVSRSVIAKNEVTDVFPNPFSTQLNIGVSAVANNTATVEIKDITGKTVYTGKYDVLAGNNVLTIGNLSLLHTGFYFVSVEIDGNTKVTKLLRE
jgi:trimeric autotransporter adhesin